MGNPNTPIRTYDTHPNRRFEVGDEVLLLDDTDVRVTGTVIGHAAEDRVWVDWPTEMRQEDVQDIIAFKEWPYAHRQAGKRKAADANFGWYPRSLGGEGIPQIPMIPKSWQPWTKGTYEQQFKQEANYNPLQQEAVRGFLLKAGMSEPDVDLLAKTYETALQSKRQQQNATFGKTPATPGVRQFGESVLQKPAPAKKVERATELDQWPPNHPNSVSPEMRNRPITKSDPRWRYQQSQNPGQTLQQQAYASEQVTPQEQATMDKWVREQPGRTPEDALKLLRQWKARQPVPTAQIASRKLAAVRKEACKALCRCADQLDTKNRVQRLCAHAIKAVASTATALDTLYSTEKGDAAAQVATQRVVATALTIADLLRAGPLTAEVADQVEEKTLEAMAYPR